MEAMAERGEYEERLGGDLVRRRSKNGITHHTHSDFGGPIEGPEVITEIESKSNGERVETDSRFVTEEAEEEEESEVINGEEESKRSLFGGRQEGMSFEENEGSDASNGLSTMEHQMDSDFLPKKNNYDHILEEATIPECSNPETKHKYFEISKTEITNIFSTAETSKEDHGIAADGFSNGTSKPDESNVLQEADVGIPEFDVEKVLHKQETHDLFCPNCNSCITKRVILRRRKRKVQEISPSEETQEIVISETLPIAPPSETERPEIQEIVISETLPIPPPSETERPEQSVEDTRGAFRCLECFSIFIPIGRGFKLFSFGGKDSKETNRDTPQLTTSDAPASLPAVQTDLEGGTGDEQRGGGVFSVQERSPLISQPELLPEQSGIGDKQRVGGVVSVQEQSPLSSQPELLPEQSGTGDEQRVGVVVTVQEQSPRNSQPELFPEQSGQPELLPEQSGQPELLPEQSGEPSLLPSGEQEGSMAVHADIKARQTKLGSMESTAEQTLPTKLDADGGNKHPDLYDNGGSVIAENKALEGRKEEPQMLIHRSEAPALPSTIDPQKDVIGIGKIDRGKQVVVSVHKEPDQTVVSITSATDNIPETEPLLSPVTTTGTAPSAAPAAATASGGSQIDIIKSIVYGGLLESIASLSVVTSAAGANAKTLNILALGAANMFGGLFILAHNLWVLKQETNTERYEEALGRPGHFTLHSTFAVISYLVFGLLPPVIYGFTFRESDNREYKLIAVASASLLCIFLLAIAKAYARRSPLKDYMKTISYYVSLWVMVCGVSYVAGVLLDKLLEKLGLFESSTSVAMRALKTPWASSY